MEDGRLKMYVGRLKMIGVGMLIMMACGAGGQQLETVAQVDLQKYAGRWYEIASYPTGFQKGCRCTTAEYELIPGRKYLGVVNRCIRFRDGRSKVSTVRGRAFVVEGSGNAKLKVQFFWPFRGDYHIIGLAGDYAWAVVGHPGRKYLWILSRESYMPTDTYKQILSLVREKGYDPRILQKTPQICDRLQ
jgi:apolipoprotein D and lipocalin family protein